MLESLTIVNKGGLILYQYKANPSLINSNVSDERDKTNQEQALNNLLALTLQNPHKDYHITAGITFCWIQHRDWMLIAMYPDILFEGPRQYLKLWAQQLLDKTLHEYKLYYTSVMQNTAEAGAVTNIRPDPTKFDATFQVLLERSKSQKQQLGQQQSTAAEGAAAPNTSSTTNNNTNNNTKATGKKEKRQWHDGNAKVTDKAMAELDMSSSAAPDNDQNGGAQDAHERALQEARQAYLPNDSDLIDEDDELPKSTCWSSSITGMLQQLSGAKKVLTKADLELPLDVMKNHLMSKNVATNIAQNLCDNVSRQLVGKRLNSFARVKTAVRQGMEDSIQRLLSASNVDLLRAVLTKKSSWSSRANQRPYVISVMGINGIGKTTTLAKLAYYFLQNNCQPLLVAGDTFRSGAVEQLRVHADCLQVPLFSQGYSKDPSTVAKAAIQHATEQGNDVVLIDTAGRMQNNVPLMKALSKLVQENKPDFVILVCEALVGHDGLDQYQLFRQAANINGLILTKYDTVSNKVGAVLTLTQESSAPIVFIGTGQKYHHLKKLSVPSVTNSLLS